MYERERERERRHASAEGWLLFPTWINNTSGRGRVLSCSPKTLLGFLSSPWGSFWEGLSAADQGTGSSVLMESASRSSEDEGDFGRRLSSSSHQGQLMFVSLSCFFLSLFLSIFFFFFFAHFLCSTSSLPSSPPLFVQRAKIPLLVYFNLFLLSNRVSYSATTCLWALAFLLFWFV